MKTTRDADVLAAVMAQITSQGGDLDGAPCELTLSAAIGTEIGSFYVMSRVSPWTGLRVFLNVWRKGVTWRSAGASAGATAFEGGPEFDAALAEMPAIEVSLAPRAGMSVCDPFTTAAALKAHDAQWPEWVPGRAGTTTLPGKFYSIRHRETRAWLRSERWTGCGLRTKPWTRAPHLGSVFIGGPDLDRALRARCATLEAVATTRATPRMGDFESDLARALARVSA